METIRRELGRSFRLIGTGELRLFAGGAGALVAFALWVGATGAAIEQIATFAGLSTSVDPWTSETTGLAGIAFVLWVVLPALVAVFLLDREVKNHRGKLEHHYRITHPSALLVPPLVVVVLGILAAFVAGSAPRLLLLVVLVATVFFHVRVLVYCYRVFSFSRPRLVQATLVVTIAVVALAILVETARAVGREALVAAAGSVLGRMTGIESLPEILVGSTAIGGVAVPTMLGLATATPLLLGGLYLLTQTLVASVLRVREPTVYRSALRNGQRHPTFARPNVASDSTSIPKGRGTTDGSGTTSDHSPSRSMDESAGSTTDSRDGTDDSTDDSADEGADNSRGNVSHTRVFTPPSEQAETAVSGGTEECPFCEATVERTADTCDNCGANL